MVARASKTRVCLSRLRIEIRKAKTSPNCFWSMQFLTTQPFFLFHVLAWNNPQLTISSLNLPPAVSVPQWEFCTFGQLFSPSIVLDYNKLSFLALLEERKILSSSKLFSFIFHNNFIRNASPIIFKSDSKRLQSDEVRGYSGRKSRAWSSILPSQSTHTIEVNYSVLLTQNVEHKLTQLKIEERPSAEHIKSIKNLVILLLLSFDF